jgi:hypothetical protein
MWIGSQSRSQQYLTLVTFPVSLTSGGVPLQAAGLGTRSGMFDLITPCIVQLQDPCRCPPTSIPSLHSLHRTTSRSLSLSTNIHPIIIGFIEKPCEIQNGVIWENDGWIRQRLLHVNEVIPE